MTLAITFPNDGGVDANGRVGVFGPPGVFKHTGYYATFEVFASLAKPGLSAFYGFGTSADLHCNRANGTVDAPTYPQSGDRLIVIAGRAFDESTGDFNTSSAAFINTLTANSSATPGAATPNKWTLEGTKAGASGRSTWWTAQNGNFEVGCAGSGYRTCFQGEGSQIVNALLNSCGDTLLWSAGANCTVYDTVSRTAAMLYVTKRDTDRSINCAGTVNTSGSDYAEYEAKAEGCGDIVPGQIIGFNCDGKITDKWADAISFGVVSTAPSFVGGDVEGADDTHEIIAYCGKVPVNVTNAVPGNYIIATQDGEGIKGWAQSQWSNGHVGRVRRILPDGRAEIAVSL